MQEYVRFWGGLDLGVDEMVAGFAAVDANLDGQLPFAEWARHFAGGGHSGGGWRGAG